MGSGSALEAIRDNALYKSTGYFFYFTLRSRLPVSLNPLECKGSYSATSNNMKPVYTLSVYTGGAVTFGTANGGLGGPQPQLAQAPSHCTKCNSPPINSQCTNHRIAV